jgi:hypothetical protein
MADLAMLSLQIPGLSLCSEQEPSRKFLTKVKDEYGKASTRKKQATAKQIVRNAFHDEKKRFVDVSVDGDSKSDSRHVTVTVLTSFDAITKSIYYPGPGLCCQAW